MGWMYVIGPCIGCGQIFTFNPDLVPSVRIDGEREPICQNCVDHANVNRVSKGLEPIIPHSQAYDPQEVM
jgi:hypothetical protein